jgi:nucleotide-binding universal stress UspA family protein
MIKKILFPAEFADFDVNTYRYALELAKVFEAELAIMHAYGKTESGLGRGYGSEKEDDVQEVLEKFVAENTPEAFQTMDIQRIATLDYPIEGILHVAKDIGANLIVMSTVSYTQPGITHLSDQTLNIIRRADAMVLAVPPKVPFDGFETIVFSTDFEFDDLIVINELRRWCKKLDSKLHILHVGRDEIDRMKALEEAYAGQNNMAFDYIEGDKVKKTIEVFTEAIKPDMVVFTTTKRSFLSRILEGSVTQGLAKNIDAPMLTIKQKKQ